MILPLLDLLHDQKVRLIEEKPVLYSSLADIHTRVEVIYDSIKKFVDNLSIKPVKKRVVIGKKEIEELLK